MKFILSLLSVLFVVACGDTNYIYPAATDVVSTPDAGTIVIRPEVSISWLETYTRMDSIEVTFKVTKVEKADLYFYIDGGFDGRGETNMIPVDGDRIYNWAFNNRRCGTPYQIVAWAKDGSVKSEEIQVPTRTLECPPPPPTDTTSPILKLTLLPDFTTANSGRVVYESDEDGLVTYTIMDDKGWVSTDTVEVVGKQAYLREWDMLVCNTPHTVMGRVTDRAGNKSFGEVITFRTSFCLPTVTLSFSNETSVGAGATMTVGNTAENGTCQVYGKRDDGSSWFYGSTMCAPGANYWSVNSWSKGRTSTYFVVFQNTVNTAKSADASFTTKNDYEIALSFDSWEADGFNVKWEAQKSYESVNTQCWLNDGSNLSWSMSDGAGLMSYTVRFSKLGPGTYYCRTYGYVQFHNTWIPETSPTITVIIPSAPKVGSLTLSPVYGINASPETDQTANVGTTDLPVLAVEMTAKDGAKKVYQLTLEACGVMHTANDLRSIRLYQDNSMVPFATANQMVVATINGKSCLTYTWTAVDNLLLARIEPGITPTIYVKADVGGQQDNIYLGDNFRFRMTVKAKDAVSGEMVDAIGAPEAAGLTTIVPFNVTITGEAPASGSVQTQFVGNGTQLGRFKITNNGNAKVEIRNMKFVDHGSHTGTIVYKLTYSDQNSTNYTAYTASSSTSVDFGDLSTYFSIDGGAYRYITVSVSQISGSMSGDTCRLSVNKLGDITFGVKEIDLGYDGDGDGFLNSGIYMLPVNGTPSLGTIVKN